MMDLLRQISIYRIVIFRENIRIIPFRESKLTRLFQNNFNGRGKAAMIVNVNQLSSMFDETMQVFKFSAIASKVGATLHSVH